MRETLSDSPRLAPLAAVGCALAIAACGGSPKPATSAGLGAHASALRFAACMRSHGVANLPDPGSSDATPAAPGPVDKSSPAFQSALQACRPLMPAGALQTTAGAASPAQRAALVARARCMRSHGVPNFPDPSAAGASPATVGSVNKTSPAFEAAAKACGGPGDASRLQVAR